MEMNRRDALKTVIAATAAALLPQAIPAAVTRDRKETPRTLDHYLVRWNEPDKDGTIFAPGSIKLSDTTFALNRRFDPHDIIGTANVSVDDRGIYASGEVLDPSAFDLVDRGEAHLTYMLLVNDAPLRGSYDHEMGSIIEIAMVERRDALNVYVVPTREHAGHTHSIGFHLDSQGIGIS